MLPPGFLGTRADVLVDIILLATAVTPFLMLYAFRLARRANYAEHRRAQIILPSVMLVAVVLFEIDIRMSGADAFLAGSSFPYKRFLSVFLVVHVAVAIISFLGWVVLATISSRRFLKVLPGSFSAIHRFYGKLIFSGVTFTAVSGIALYFLVFVYQ